VDSGNQTAQVWLLGVQRKLYQWSREHPEEPYCDLWNWVTDPRNLQMAWKTIAGNRGKRTPGVDGETVASIASGIGTMEFLRKLREELRSGDYRPSPARRKWIAKPGKPGKFRPLGIPTVKDRVVQCAVKQVLEPIFEARFWPVSYGFRPGRGSQACLEHIRVTIRSRGKPAADGRRHNAPYQWVIEGDIEGCFDNIGHHPLMKRVRHGVADRKVNRLLVRFLKAGVLEDVSYSPTDTGTPQGGVLSPLLANIALGVIEERYQDWVKRPESPELKSDGIKLAAIRRDKDRRAGRPVFYPVRYADDFLIFVSGTEADALAEKQALATYLHEAMGLTLSPEKTRITALTEGCRFLGCRVRLKWDDRFGLHARIEIPREPINGFRRRVNRLARRPTLRRSLKAMLQELNPYLRGWSAYYRYCVGAKPILASLDWHVRQRLWLWLRAKHKRVPGRKIASWRRPSTAHPGNSVWAEGGTEQFLMSYVPVRRFDLKWMKKPEFAKASGEPDAQRKVHVRFGEKAWETDGGNTAPRPRLTLLRCKRELICAPEAWGSSAAFAPGAPF